MVQFLGWHCRVVAAEALPRLRGLKVSSFGVFLVGAMRCRGIAPTEGTESIQWTDITFGLVEAAEALPRLRGLKAVLLSTNADRSVALQRHCPD